MSIPPVNIPTLAADLAALGAGAAALGTVLATLQQAATDLQNQITAADNAGQDSNDLNDQFTLVNTWINTLNAAVAAAPGGGPAPADLLAAMQAVDGRTGVSAGLNNLVLAVDAAVKAG